LFFLVFKIINFLNLFLKNWVDINFTKKKKKNKYM